MRRLVGFILLTLLSASANWESRADTIAVVFSANVDAYQEAFEGFRDAVDGHDIVKFDMRGDFKRGRKIAKDLQENVKPDLILAVGLWALQLFAEIKTETPVVYTMVLNPPSVIGAKLPNITGASINVPVEKSINLLRQLGPEIRRVGVVFTPQKTGYLVNEAKAVAEAVGIELVTREIKSSKEAVKALKELQTEGIDAIWILPDEGVLDPKVLKFALLSSYRERVPLLGLSERQARMGAMVSLSFDSSEDIGRQAGELAKNILMGKQVKELPYTEARQVQLTVNLKAAKKLGFSVPVTIVQSANTVIQ